MMGDDYSILHAEKNRLEAENERLTEAITVLAMKPDSKGHVYGSTLHDVGKMQMFARNILVGYTVEEALNR